MLNRLRDKKVGFLLVFVLLSACLPSDDQYPVLNGNSLSQVNLRGKVVFINYWAEWCEPCREEIPEFNRFAKSTGNDVLVLSVNFDGVSGDALIGQISKMGLEFPTLLRDPREELGVKPPLGLPETLVLNREGKVSIILTGPQTEEVLKKILSEHG